MVVHVLIYEANSMEAVEQWHRDRADDIDRVLGLKRVHFIRKNTNSLAGAIMYFESPEDLRQYKTSERFEWLQESIREMWATGPEPVQNEVYRVMEASENAAAEV